MIDYLTETRIWLLPSPRIGLLQGKSILIVDGESEYQSRVDVSYDQPTNSESGSCTVSALQAFEDDAFWVTPLPDTMPPPSQTHYKKQFFSQAAVDLIRDNIEESHGELLLVIPQE
jgi:hypothetical protein